MSYLPYERIRSHALTEAIHVRKQDGECLLVLQPFGWHLDGKHMPNVAEHFERDGICEEHNWDVVCDYGPYIAVVKPKGPPSARVPKDRGTR